MSKKNFKIIRVAKDVNPASYDIFDGHNGRVGLFVSRENAKAIVEYLNMQGYVKVSEIPELEVSWLRKYADVVIEAFMEKARVHMSIVSKLYGKNIVG